MTGFQTPDWRRMFIPDLPLLESFLRGSVVYLSLVVLFRVILKRQGGTIGLPDVMLVVLVSECVSAALSAEAKSVPNGLAAVLSLLFWNYSLDWLAYRWPWLRRLLEPQPLQLVKDGRPIRAHLEREHIADDELAAQLRENGIDDVSRVKAAYVEAEGTVSVIPAESGSENAPTPTPGAATGSESEGNFEQAVQKFLAAAEEVQAAVAWHEVRAAEHRSAAKAARDALARYGVPRSNGRRGGNRQAVSHAAANSPSAAS